MNCDMKADAISVGDSRHQSFTKFNEKKVCNGKTTNTFRELVTDIYRLSWCLIPSQAVIDGYAYIRQPRWRSTTRYFRLGNAHKPFHGPRVKHHACIEEFSSCVWARTHGKAYTLSVEPVVSCEWLVSVLAYPLSC